MTVSGPTMTIVISAESFVWGLQGMCQVHRVPFVPDLVLQQIPPPYSLSVLQHAAQALGLKSGVRSVAAKEVAQQPLPCLVALKPRVGSLGGSSPPQGAQGQPVANRNITAKPLIAGSAANEPLCRLGLVLRCDATRVLLFEEGAKSPDALSLADFESRYAGSLLLFSHESDAAQVADPDVPKGQAFGFRWFIPELLKHRDIWRDVLFASLAIQVMALATPLFTQVVIDKVIVHHTTNTLLVIGIALGIIMVFSAGMTWLRQYFVLHTGNRIDAVLGTQVFRHLFRLPMGYFHHRPTGVLVARVHGVETIREFITGAAAAVMLDFPFLLIFLAIMFYYSVMLTLIALGILLVIAVISFAIRPILRERLNQQFLLGARNQSFVTEYVSGMETVKSLQMEPQLDQRYGSYLSSYLAASFNTRQIGNTYNVVANLLEQILTLLILCIGAWIVLSSREMTIGMLVAFQMFAGRLSGPVLRLAGLWQEFQQADIAVKRLGDIMGAPGEPYALRPAREGGGSGRIEIKNLSFRYADNLPYLYRNFNLVIDPGTCVALMGPSGCGKSTLAKLLQGFYSPGDGAILLGGHDINYLSANELRSYFGVVPQDTELFSGSIYENLILANPLAGFDQVIEACKVAEIHQMIERLPEGYQTRIGEHGVGLSGGQKQRIAIARALLKRPKILIFDEATSSLDEATAENFAKTVNQLKGKVSMLFIAHQLPKGLRVDEVVRLG